MSLQQYLMLKHKRKNLSLMFVLSAPIPKPSNDLPLPLLDSKREEEEISKLDKARTQQDWQLSITRESSLSRNSKVSYMISKHN